MTEPLYHWSWNTVLSRWSAQKMTAKATIKSMNPHAKKYPKHPVVLYNVKTRKKLSFENIAAACEHLRQSHYQWRWGDTVLSTWSDPMTENDIIKSMEKHSD